jgi:hypothetical protein
MNQPKFAERLDKGRDSRDSWLMHEGWIKSEKLPFDFRKMFAAIALNVGSATVRRGYFCDVAVDLQVPRYLKGYPDIFQELIYSLVDNILSQINNGGIVVKVDSVPVKSGESHLVTVEISDTVQDFCVRSAALETILERYSDGEQYFSGNGSSWISWKKQLKSPLNGTIMVQSLYGWGSRYRIEFELESLEGQGDFTKSL